MHYSFTKLFSLLLIVHLSMPLAQALEISISRNISISDSDSVSTGDAGYDTTPPVIGTTSATLDTAAQSVEMGYRFTGFNSGRGVSNINQQVRSITQSIDVSVTWTLTSTVPGETYNFTLNPELHAYLNILDDNNGEASDESTFSNLDATLTQNGSQIPLDQLGLTGGTRTTVGSSTVNDTATRTFSNLTGNHEFTLQYTGSTTAAWKIAGLQNNRTANAVLWGQDGTMDGDSFADSFDNYSNSTARNADGLFVPATVELIVVPEMSSLVLASICLLCGTIFSGIHRRSFRLIEWRREIGVER
jgi:hypothetical protein